MKIKIDEYGYLWLERAGKMKQVECPEGSYGRTFPGGTATYDVHWSCGDWCALFREGGDSHIAEVFLCKAEYYCAIENFIDERRKK